MKEITIDDIFRSDGALSEFINGYSERPSQINMANINLQALQENKHAVIEGPCGTGKSFAYIFPVLKKIADNGFKENAVLVTSGIALQEQLFYEDVPFALKVMEWLDPAWPKDFKFTLLKGRRNFLCKDRVANYDLGEFSGTSALSNDFEKILEFSRETKTGDLSEMSFVPSNEDLKLISCVESSDCSGKNCESYDDCYYQKHKQNLSISNIIITNYHMLFTDNKISGAILPDYNMLVFDEAHEVPNIFREFQAMKLNIHTFNNIRNKVSEITNKVKDYKLVITTSMEKLITHAEQFLYLIHRQHADAMKWSPLVIDSQSQFPDTDNLVFTLNSIIGDMETVEGKSKGVLEYLSQEDDRELYNSHQSVLNIALSLIDICKEAIYLLTSVDSIASDENNVLWVENSDTNVVTIGLKKVDVGSEIRNSFFDRENVSCILTSATMSVANSFSYVKSQFGLDKLSEDKILEYVGESPFDLTAQQLWYLPANAVEGNKQEFGTVAIEQIKELIVSTGGGTLCLFTSISAMRNCKTTLSRTLPAGHFRILTQGDMPRNKLLEEFKNDKDSILLGTKSFFTGVDVPGSALRCVVIDKFPFPTPSDPVQQKLKLKENSFYRFSIPEMVISLKQAVGRGVRTVNDKCVIAILDGRMATAKYKGRVATSFNYKKQSTRDINVVSEFCHKHNLI